MWASEYSFHSSLLRHEGWQSNAYHVLQARAFWFRFVFCCWNFYNWLFSFFSYADSFNKNENSFIGLHDGASLLFSYSDSMVYSLLYNISYLYGSLQQPVLLFHNSYKFGFPEDNYDLYTRFCLLSPNTREDTRSVFKKDVDTSVEYTLDWDNSFGFFYDFLKFSFVEFNYLFLVSFSFTFAYSFSFFLIDLVTVKLSLNFVDFFVIFSLDILFPLCLVN